MSSQSKTEVQSFEASSLTVNVVIITDSPRPPHMALTQRIHLLAKSIAKEGDTVVVRNVGPYTGGASIPGAVCLRETYDGVEYEYFERKLRIAGRLVRHVEFIRNLIGAARRTCLQRPRADAIILYSVYLPAMVAFKLVSLCTRAAYVTERTEYPFLNTDASTLRRLLKWATVRLGYRLFDGMLVISERLRSVFGLLVNRKAPIMVVPILCDPREFQSSTLKQIPADGSDRIVYAGDLSERKDGFLTLVRAFAILAAQRPRARLVVLGMPAITSDGAAAKQLVRELELEERVQFRKFVPRQEYVRLLASASLLALAKPRNLQNDYCMPTKVAEYLMSGRPTIVSRCGVLAHELRDGENVFLAEPGNPENMASKMLWIFDHKARAEEVGLAGREYAMQCFDFRLQTERIAEFLLSLRALRAVRNFAA